MTTKTMGNAAWWLLQAGMALILGPALLHLHFGLSAVFITIGSFASLPLGVAAVVCHTKWLRRMRP